MLASIDIGSNTVRLLIAEARSTGGLHPVRYERRITRLAGELSDRHGLHADAMSRTLTALDDFGGLCRASGVSACQAVGTAAFRRAVNGPVFADRIYEQTGVPVKIITGEEEAHLTAAGVQLVLTDPSDNLLIFDIGGGSTEFIHVLNGRVQWVDSFPLGVVRLCDEFETSAAMADQIQLLLNKLPAEILRHAGTLTLVGTAGTVTSLAAMELEMVQYDWRRINNAVLQRTNLQALLSRLAPMTPAQREALPGLEPGRGDLILPGLQIVLALLEMYRAEYLTVSDFGILEGVALELAGGGCLQNFHPALN